MADIEKLMDDLKRKRDEIRVQLHLASKEAEDEWDELTAEWDRFVARSHLDKSAEEVGEAAKELGLKIKAAFDRLQKPGD